MTPTSKASVLLSLLLLAGCTAIQKDIHIRGASPPPRFMHQQHRETYAIGQADLAHLQFFVSTKILAHDLDAAGSDGVVQVPEGTPGLATGSGPTWIRVQFQPGGQGVVFLADPAARGDTPYLLATEAPGGSGYQLVRDVPDHTMQVGARRYRIVEGSDAHLLVDGDDLKKLIEGRRRIEGQRKPEAP